MNPMDKESPQSVQQCPQRFGIKLTCASAGRPFSRECLSKAWSQRVSRGARAARRWIRVAWTVVGGAHKLPIRTYAGAKLGVAVQRHGLRSPNTTVQLSSQRPLTLLRASLARPHSWARTPLSRAVGSPLQPNILGNGAAPSQLWMVLALTPMRRAHLDRLKPSLSQLSSA